MFLPRACTLCLAASPSHVPPKNAGATDADQPSFPRLPGKFLTEDPPTTGLLLTEDPFRHHDFFRKNIFLTDSAAHDYYTRLGLQAVSAVSDCLKEPEERPEDRASPDSTAVAALPLSEERPARPAESPQFGAEDSGKNLPLPARQTDREQDSEFFRSVDDPAFPYWLSQPISRTVSDWPHFRRLLKAQPPTTRAELPFDGKIPRFTALLAALTYEPTLQHHRERLEEDESTTMAAIRNTGALETLEELVLSGESRIKYVVRRADITSEQPSPWQFGRYRLDFDRTGISSKSSSEHRGTSSVEETSSSSEHLGKVSLLELRRFAEVFGLGAVVEHLDSQKLPEVNLFIPHSYERLLLYPGKLSDGWQIEVRPVADEGKNSDRRGLVFVFSERGKQPRAFLEVWESCPSPRELSYRNSEVVPGCLMPHS